MQPLTDIHKHLHIILACMAVCIRLCFVVAISGIVAMFTLQ